MDLGLQPLLEMTGLSRTEYSRWKQPRRPELITQPCNLGKRSPMLRPLAKRLTTTELFIPSHHPSDNSRSLSRSALSKKRGRNLYSNELETYLLSTISNDWKSKIGIPDRIWIAKQARSFISKNNLNLKCSKGWLDKFMKRNEAAIQQSKLS